MPSFSFSVPATVARCQYPEAGGLGRCRGVGAVSVWNGGVAGGRVFLLLPPSGLRQKAVPPAKSPACRCRGSGAWVLPARRCFYSGRHGQQRRCPPRRPSRRHAHGTERMDRTRLPELPGSCRHQAPLRESRREPANVRCCPRLWLNEFRLSSQVAPAAPRQPGSMPQSALTQRLSSQAGRRSSASQRLFFLSFICSPALPRPNTPTCPANSLQI